MSIARSSSRDSSTRSLRSTHSLRVSYSPMSGSLPARTLLTPLWRSPDRLYRRSGQTTQQPRSRCGVAFAHTCRIRPRGVTRRVRCALHVPGGRRDVSLWQPGRVVVRYPHRAECRRYLHKSPRAGHGCVLRLRSDDRADRWCSIRDPTIASVSRGRR